MAGTAKKHDRAVERVRCNNKTRSPYMQPHTAPLYAKGPLKHVSGVGYLLALA